MNVKLTIILMLVDIWDLLKKTGMTMEILSLAYQHWDRESCYWNIGNGNW